MTSIIVVLFLAVFLLREWIIQNAVPGVLAAAGGAPEPLPVVEAPEPLPLPPPPFEPVRNINFPLVPDDAGVPLDALRREHPTPRPRVEDLDPADRERLPHFLKEMERKLKEKERLNQGDGGGGDGEEEEDGFDRSDEDEDEDKDEDGNTWSFFTDAQRDAGLAAHHTEGHHLTGKAVIHFLKEKVVSHSNNFFFFL